MSDCAIVTGATGLLGRQILKAFQSSGWKSVGTGFTRANPPEILKVDLSVEAEVTALLDDVKYELQRGVLRPCFTLQNHLLT